MQTRRLSSSIQRHSSACYQQPPCHERRLAIVAANKHHDALTKGPSNRFVSSSKAAPLNGFRWSQWKQQLMLCEKGDDAKHQCLVKFTVPCRTWLYPTDLFYLDIE